jgi:hypothetical protein
MDVYEASANMIAFSEFVVVAAKAEFGAEIDVRAEVSGFDRGSFVTEIVFRVSGAAASIFGAVTTKQLWETIRGSIELWKFLRGLKPKQLEHHIPEQSITVTNNDGQILQVKNSTVNLVFSEKGSEAVGQFIRHALEKSGMDRLEISTKDSLLADVSQNESQYFLPVSPSETVTDVTIPMVLIIEAPVFKDGNKWRFSDGSQSFFATIEDRGFLDRVNAGERFGKGDILVSDVRINQQQTGMKLTSDRIIVRVKEHKVGPTQLIL